MRPRPDRAHAATLIGAGAVAVLAGCARAGTATPPVVAPPAAVTGAGAGSAAPAAPAPADTARARRGSGAGDRRFLIVAVDDSTVTMLAPGDRWLRQGTYGIAVDPRRRDALVARLFVQTRVADTAVALVTGQTTRMSTDYVAIFRPPAIPVLRQASFWGGLAAGTALGAGVVLAFVLGR